MIPLRYAQRRILAPRPQAIAADYDAHAFDSLATPASWGYARESLTARDIDRGLRRARCGPHLDAARDLSIPEKTR
jgi:hypothetical protein